MKKIRQKNVRKWFLCFLKFKNSDKKGIDAEIFKLIKFEQIS